MRRRRGLHHALFGHPTGILGPNCHQDAQRRRDDVEAFAALLPDALHLPGATSDPGDTRGGEGAVFVFQPARDQLDNLVAVALKALFFEAVLSCPDRVRGDPTVPLAMYIADEFQRYITSDAVHGEQSFFDTCRSHRAACLVACQSVASLEHALSEGAGGARRDAAALAVLWTNTANKLVFRTTDPATAHRLEGLCPQRPGLVDVVRARPPATLGVGECYAALADGRFERRQLEPLVLEPVREAQASRERFHAEEEERTDEYE